MAMSKISIRNRRLAFPETMTFIRFLKKKYPTEQSVITFIPMPIVSITVEGCDFVCHFRGSCAGINITISVYQSNVAEQLRILAQYRHAMQTNLGIYPDSEAHFFSIAGFPIKSHGGAEQDATRFSTYAVERFLQNCRGS